jgi:hypothetical protein
MELRIEEGKHQRLINCVNHYIAGRTRKEYLKDNKDEISEYKNEYNKLKETCELCGLQWSASFEYGNNIGYLLLASIRILRKLLLQ